MNLKKTYMINNNTPTEIDTINKSLKSSLLSLFFIQSPSYVAALPHFLLFKQYFMNISLLSLRQFALINFNCKKLLLSKGLIWFNEKSMLSRFSFPNNRFFKKSIFFWFDWIYIQINAIFFLLNDSVCVNLVIS